ncbi:MAG: ABC transporter ATP-binding protein [Anaerolineae bacterium]
MASVMLKHVWKIYEGKVIAVKDLNIHCEQGEFFALLGPSGCGKSSTLRMIAGLEEITKGEIWFDNTLVNSLRPRQRNVAMVFETYALYPYLSVYDNIAFPLRLRGLSKEEIDRRVRWAADFLGITDILHVGVRGLSSGQMQSVGIGRAIVREPSVLLMDEPISHLEARQRARMREELVKLHNRLETTTIYVTHDQVEAMTMADRIAVMNLGELQQVGTPKEVYEQPRTEFVGGFIGEPPMNFADGDLQQEDGQFCVVSPSFKVPLGPVLRERLRSYRGPSRVRLGIRPENIGASLTPREGLVTASVFHLEPQGERAILSARLAGGELFLVIVGPDFRVDLDSPVYLDFRGPVHIFRAENGLNVLYD